MTKEEFKTFWTLTYPDTIPISYLFKKDYSERWFRIHSLPDSKRYAETENEWGILLKRQNQIITDIFGENEKILLVTGEYNWDENATFNADEEAVFKPYDFILLDNIDLFDFKSENYNKGDFYKPAFAETIWNLNQHDKLLKEIANDNLRAFFISINKSVIVAPYDGGIDFVFKNIQTKDFYKNQYKNWLSERVDGL